MNTCLVVIYDVELYDGEMIILETGATVQVNYSQTKTTWDCNKRALLSKIKSLI